MSGFDPIVINVYDPKETRVSYNQGRAYDGILSGLADALGSIAKVSIDSPEKFPESEQRKTIFYTTGKDGKVKKSIEKISRDKRINYELFIDSSRDRILLEGDTSKKLIITHSRNINLKYHGATIREGNIEVIISTGSLTEDFWFRKGNKSFNRGYLTGAHMPIHQLLSSPSAAEEKIHCEKKTCAMHSFYNLKDMDEIIAERQEEETKEVFCTDTLRLIRGNLAEQGMTF